MMLDGPHSPRLPGEKLGALCGWANLAQIGTVGGGAADRVARRGADEPLKLAVPGPNGSKLGGAEFIAALPLAVLADRGAHGSRGPAAGPLRARALSWPANT